MNIDECLNKTQAWYILWVTIMNQSQDAKEVSENTLKLIKRLGNPDKYCQLKYEEIWISMNSKKKLHRFPNKMSLLIYESCQNVHESFSGDPRQIFFGTYTNVFENLCKFKGIGTHKAGICCELFRCFKTNVVNENYLGNLGCNISENVFLDEINIIRSLNQL